MVLISKLFGSRYVQKNSRRQEERHYSVAIKMNGFQNISYRTAVDC